MQFARKSTATKGTSGPLPEFGATRGQEISKGILGIEASFESQIEKLRRLDYDILDVKTSRWHDDYNGFKNSVKDLEVKNFRDLKKRNVANTAIVLLVAHIKVKGKPQETNNPPCLVYVGDVH